MCIMINDQLIISSHSVYTQVTKGVVVLHLCLTVTDLHDILQIGNIYIYTHIYNMWILHINSF